MNVATIETRDYLTCREAAEELGLTPASVRVYCNNKENGKSPSLKGIHVGRDWIIHKSEIARYKKERNDPGRPPGDE
jgi:predicted transcriptional regulator